MALTAACGDSGAPLEDADGDGDGGSGVGGSALNGSGGSDTGGSASTAGGGDVGGAPASGIAPEGAVDGEHTASEGDNTVEASPSADDVLRVDLEPNEHVGFFLAFDGDFDGVELELSRWDGEAPVVLGFTDGGAGLRTLAAFDASGPRTFWIRVRSDSDGFTGTLAVTRTPFHDGAQCEEDCDRLLQFPMRNDPTVDGYDWTTSTVFRYQFGRRDLVMFVRHAARQMALAGRAPIFPEDFSQWNGETPGNDVGAPRHASHQRGKDVDVSLYGTDGLAPWRSYCEVEYTSDGRECIAGTASGLDGAVNAEMFGAFLESGRVTMSFLDQELIGVLQDGADEAVDADALDPAFVPLINDGQHLQHWPNHDNHVHVRVSEEPYGAASVTPPSFEAP